MKLLIQDYPIFEYVQQPLGSEYQKIQTAKIEEYHRQDIITYRTENPLYKPSQMVTLARVDGKYYIYQQENANYYRDFMAVINNNVVFALIYNFPNIQALENKFSSMFGVTVEEYNKAIEQVKIENGAVEDAILKRRQNESYKINEEALEFYTGFENLAGIKVLPFENKIRNYVISHTNNPNTTKVLLLVGHTGIGKSSIIQEVVKELDEEDLAEGGWGYALHTFKLGFLSKVDTQGYTATKKDAQGNSYADDSPRADILYTTDHFVQMCREIVTKYKDEYDSLDDTQKKYFDKFKEGAKTPVLFFDEINRAKTSISEQYFTLFSNHLIDSKKTYTLSVIIAACNYFVATSESMEKVRESLQEMYNVEMYNDGAFGDRFDVYILDPRDMSVVSGTIKHLSEKYKIKFPKSKKTEDFLWDLYNKGLLFAVEYLDIKKPADEQVWKFPTFRTWEYVLQYLSKQAQTKSNTILVSYEFIKTILGGDANFDEAVKKVFDDYNIDYTTIDNKLNNIGDDGVKLKVAKFITDEKTGELKRDNKGNPITELVDTVIYDKTDWFLQTSIESNIPFMMLGRHGIGKTFRVKNYAQATNAKVINITLSNQDPATINGAPMKKNLIDAYLADMPQNIVELDKTKGILAEVAEYAKRTYFPEFTTVPIPFEQQKEISEAVRKGQRVIIFFDEITRCDPIVQSAVFEAISEGKLLGAEFKSDKEASLVSIVAAGNYGSIYNVTPLDAASSARFSISFTKEITLAEIDSWISVMLRNPDEYHPALSYALSELRRSSEVNLLVNFFNISEQTKLQGGGELTSPDITSFRNFDDMNQTLLRVDGYVLSFDRNVLDRMKLNDMYMYIQKTKYFPANLDSKEVTMFKYNGGFINKDRERIVFKACVFLNEVQKSESIEGILTKYKITEQDLESGLKMYDKGFYDGVWSVGVGNNFAKAPALRSEIEKYICKYFMNKTKKTMADVIKYFIEVRGQIQKNFIENPSSVSNIIYDKLKEVMPRNPETGKIKLSDLQVGVKELLDRTSERLTAMKYDENTVNLILKKMVEAYGSEELGQVSEIEKDIEIKIEVEKEIKIPANVLKTEAVQLTSLCPLENAYVVNGDDNLLDVDIYTLSEAKQRSFALDFYTQSSGKILTTPPPILRVLGHILEIEIDKNTHKVVFPFLKNMYTLATNAGVSEKNYLVLGDLNNLRRFNLLSIDKSFKNQVVNFTLQELEDIPFEYKLEDIVYQGDNSPIRLDEVVFNPYTAVFKTNDGKTLQIEFYHGEYISEMSDKERADLLKQIAKQLKDEANLEETLQVAEYFKNAEILGKSVVSLILGIKDFEDETMKNILLSYGVDVQDNFTFNNPVVFGIQNAIFQNVIKSLRFVDRFVDTFLHW